MTDDETENDGRSVNELIATALDDEDENRAWDAVVALHKIGSREALLRAQELCAGDAAEERTLGAEILGQLGVPERTFPEATAATLFGMLSWEVDAEVLRAVFIGLSHNKFAGTVDIALEYVMHYDADVRRAVVLALTGWDDHRAVNALITLTDDLDSEVRNWATFAIGTQSEIDSTPLRESLAARLGDPDEDVRGEAMIGLARRKDRRALAAIRDALERNPNDHAVEAAGLTEASEFVASLIALRDSPLVSSYCLEAAIEACSSPGFERN